MSTIARITPIVGSLYALMRNALGLNVATPLESQELSCTVAPDRRLVVLGHEPIAGFSRDHGTVADEAAMLALHTLDGTTLIAEPTFVAPGDSCLRTDDPGWRWHCISGHGTTLSDWERRPLAAALDGLAAALDGLAVNGHTHAISAITGLQTALGGKQAASANLTTLAAVASTVAGRALLQVTTPATAKLPRINADDTITLIDVPSGGESGNGYLGEVADLAALLASGALLGATARIAGLGRVYMCIAEPSSAASAWIWWAATSAAVSRYVRLRVDYIPAGYLELFTLRYRMGGSWYPTAYMTSNTLPAPLVASAGSQYSGYDAYMAFDGSSSTRFHGNSETANWLKLDFGEGFGINPDAVGITPNLGSATRYPRDFAVELSDTGVFGGEQTVVYSTTGQTAWSSGVERIFEW